MERKLGAVAKRDLGLAVSPSELERALADQAANHSIEMAEEIKNARERERKHYSETNGKLQKKKKGLDGRIGRGQDQI